CRSREKVYQWGPVGPTARFSGSGSRIPGSGRGGRGGNEEGADPRMGERGGKGRASSSCSLLAARRGRAGRSGAVALVMLLDSAGQIGAELRSDESPLRRALLRE